MKKYLLVLLLSISMVTVAHSAVQLDAGETSSSAPYIFDAQSVQVNYPVHKELTDFFQFTIGSEQDISFSITQPKGSGVKAVHVYFEGVDVFGKSIEGTGTTAVDLGTLDAGSYVISIKGKTKQHAGFYTLTSPVPELSTMVLMLSGFSLIGFMSYRRREL